MLFGFCFHASFWFLGFRFKTKAASLVWSVGEALTRFHLLRLHPAKELHGNKQQADASVFQASRR
jgi:hypothetical protein